MRTMRTLILLLCSVVLAVAGSSERQLFEDVLSTLFPKHTIVVVFADRDARALLAGSKRIRLVASCDDKVDVVIGKRLEKMPASCRKFPFFAISYHGYKRAVDAIGGFYWRKGRPQLRLRKRGLEYFGLPVPEAYKKYLE